MYSLYIFPGKIYNSNQWNDVGFYGLNFNWIQSVHKYLIMPLKRL